MQCIYRYTVTVYIPRKPDRLAPPQPFCKVPSGPWARADLVPFQRTQRCRQVFCQMELRLVEPATGGKGPRTDREKTTRGCFLWVSLIFMCFFLVCVFYVIYGRRPPATKMLEKMRKSIGYQGIKHDSLVSLDEDSCALVTSNAAEHCTSSNKMEVVMEHIQDPYW